MKARLEKMSEYANCLKSLECLHVLEGHTDAVNSVAIKVI